MVTKFIILCFSSLLLASCGGGGGGSDDISTPISGGGTELTGAFVDSTVGGMSYSTPSRSGLTNANGQFKYLVGEQVTFSVGDLVIGKTVGAALVTPVNLVTGATDETNTSVTNIARFLQTIDDDGNSDNGISINPLIHPALAGGILDFSSNTFDFDSATLVTNATTLSTAGERTLVTSKTARDHLKANLHKSISGSYSGTYTGNFTDGTENVPWSGTWEFIINDQGAISGNATDQEGASESFNGQVSTDGSAVSGGSTTGSSFSLTIDSVGIVKGTWKATDQDDHSFKGSGTLAGTRGQAITTPEFNPVPVGAEAVTGESIWPPLSVGQILDQNFSQNVAHFNSPSIALEGEQDWWSFSGKDTRFFFFIKTGADHQASDATDMACIVNVFDQNGNMKYSVSTTGAASADAGYHKNCEVLFTPPDNGIYYLRVRASSDFSVKTGSYSMVVTKDTNPQFSTAVNMTKTYQINEQILNRRHNISRKFVMPDVSAISSFKGITTCTMTASSSQLNCPFFGFKDVTSGNFVSEGPVKEYELKLISGPAFSVGGATGNEKLYDWTTVPTYKIQIVNPNPLPNYNPEFPYCEEGSVQSKCSTTNRANPLIFGGAAIFHAYNAPWTLGDSFPSSFTCPQLGYSSPLSIFTGVPPAGTVEPVGTCQFRPGYL